MLYICIFSNKLDLNQAIRVSHTGAQQFLRNPAPGPCIIHKYKSENHSKNKRYYEHYLSEKTEECDSKQVKMASYKNQKLCFYCKRFNHRQDECRTRIQDKQPCTDARGRKYWPRLMRKRLKDLSQRFWHFQTTSHH